MSDTATSEAPAPAAAPAASPAPAAAPTPAAPAAESLIHAAAPAPADEVKLAEKVTVKTAEGQVDWEATAKKAEQARQHLEKRLGAGDTPPKDATGYVFTPPAAMKDFELKAERFDAFKAEALQHGLTPKQFEFVMAKYLDAVPDLMEGAAKMTASQARAELAKVWTTPAEFDASLADSQRAVQSLPADLQEATMAYGTDPVFVRLMAWVGSQMREDTAPAAAGAAPQAASAQEYAGKNWEAFTNPRHPEHARVSAEWRRLSAAAMGSKANLPL